MNWTKSRSTSSKPSSAYSGLYYDLCSHVLCNKAFRHVETLFVQGDQVRTDQNKPSFLLTKKVVCFDQYEFDYLGQIKFLHVEMPYCNGSCICTRSTC